MDRLNITWDNIPHFLPGFKTVFSIVTRIENFFILNQRQNLPPHLLIHLYSAK